MIKAVLIDDEYIVVEGLKAIVNWSGFGIEVVGSASDGVSGLELIEKEKPDIVFTDITMPRMNGLTLIENAKKIIPSGVFIIFSGYNEFEYARKALSLGVIDYLDKPVTIDKVEETLKEAIKIIDKKKKKLNWLKTS
ncbi:response regulator [Clostridium saccharoperbutylacetonicum]|uniref:response regulator n=1 Tax=Clostridium saccharoperbutylacetonicum TaxID=36745 RepID=UPI000347ABED|nr:response regulator [Clostridium saccharoperbutylacetonicum]